MSSDLASRLSSGRRRARGRAAGLGAGFGVIAAALPMVDGGAQLRAQLLLGAAGLGLLLAAMAGFAPGFACAAVAFGSDYALRLTGRHALDGLAVVEAVAIFAAVETGLRALEARSVARPDREVRAGATGRLIAMLSGAAVAAAVVLGFGGRRLPAPTAGLALGLVAAIAVLATASLLRRRAGRSTAAG